jgi:uncharacterized protein with HEPN domain
MSRVMLNKDLEVLQQIISSGRRIAKEIQNTSEMEFVRDKKSSSDVIDHIMKISDGASYLSSDFRERYKDRIPWEILDIKQSSISLSGMWSLAVYGVPFFTRRVEQVAIDEQSRLIRTRSSLTV